MKTNKKRNLKKAGFVAGVLCLASIGGVSAYLTDFDKKDNQFTVGKVSINRAGQRDQERPADQEYGSE